MRADEVKAVLGELRQAVAAVERFVAIQVDKCELLAFEALPHIHSVIETLEKSEPNVKGCGHCQRHLLLCNPCHYICPKCATVYTELCQHRRLLPHFGCSRCGPEVPVPGLGVPA